MVKYNIMNKTMIAIITKFIVVNGPLLLLHFKQSHSFFWHLGQPGVSDLGVSLTGVSLTGVSDLGTTLTGVLHSSHAGHVSWTLGLYLQTLGVKFTTFSSSLNKHLSDGIIENKSKNTCDKKLFLSSWEKIIGPNLLISNIIWLIIEHLATKLIKLAVLISLFDDNEFLSNIYLIIFNNLCDSELDTKLLETKSINSFLSEVSNIFGMIISILSIFGLEEIRAAPATAVTVLTGDITLLIGFIIFLIGFKAGEITLLIGVNAGDMAFVIGFNIFLIFFAAGDTAFPNFQER